MSRAIHELMKSPRTVSDYLATAPPKTRAALKQLRAAIKAAAPGITERISYGILGFALEGRGLLGLAGWKHHVSVYPVTGAMVAQLGPAIAPYRSGKATLRFPLAAPMPVALVRRLARLRVRERRGVQRGRP
jgi:uncharacterized protein YdhG (YjbR/CyaY superfamily)